MANIASFYELVLPFLPGAELPVVRLHARRILREFLRRTTVWRLEMPFNTVAATETYRLTPPAGQEVANIHRVELNGRKIDPATEALRALSPTNAEPRGWHSAVLPVVSFYPTPDAAYAIMVDASITIPIADVGGDTFPDDIFAEHGESISFGIIASLMQMPGKPWTQSAGSLVYDRKYNNAIHNLRNRMRDGGQPSVSTARGPKIA